MYTALALFRSCYFLEEMNEVYNTVWCAHLGNLIKILLNKDSYHERSVLRNLVFDCLRNLVRPIIYPLLLEGRIDYQFLLEMAVGTAIMSILVTLFVKKSVFARHRVIWGCVNIEFLLMFTNSLIYVLNEIEITHSGSLLMASLFIYLEIHLSLQANWLEDFIFKDLNAIGGIIHNWGFYVFYIVLIPLFFGL